MKEISGDISATYRPSVAVKWWYMIYNLVRGILGGFSLVRTQHWQPKSVAIPDDRSLTPMRVLIDIAFPAFATKHVTQKDISVLDIGAGSAYLRKRLAEHGYQGQYTGVDIYTHRDYRDDAVPQFVSELVITPIEKFTPTKPYDLVMSVTALEHIPDDFRAVKVATEAIAASGTQIHIVPGFWSLFMYLLHGYRQYSRRRLGKMFAGQNYHIYRLGGLASLLVHMFFITIPERILHRPVRHRFFYAPLVRRALHLDRWLPVCGYGFVIVVKK